MRITFVLQYYYPYIGGLESLFQNLAEGLARRSHYIQVITTHLPGTPYRERKNGVDVIRVAVPHFADRYFFTLLGIPTAIRVARSSEIIHTTPYNGAFPAFFAARLAGKPVVFTALEVLGRRWHQVERNILRAWFYRLFEKMVTKLPYDRFAAISRATFNDAVSAGMKAHRGQVIHLGVDGSFAFGSSNGRLRQLINLDREAFIYLYYGRPGITKGVDVLLRATPIIQKEVLKAHLILILANEPRAQYQSLRRLAGEMKCANIHFIPSVPRTDLIEFLRDANCIVIPSLTEGFGLTTAEACALGIPVVATRVGSIPEVISGRHVLVAPGSEEELAHGIIQVARKEWDETPLRRFSWDAMVYKYEELYQELV